MTARVEALQAALSKKQEMLTRVLERNEALKKIIYETRQQLSERIKTARESAAPKTELYNRASPYLATYRQGLLSEQIAGTGLTARVEALQAALSKKQEMLTRALERNEAFKKIIYETRQQLSERIKTARESAERIKTARESAAAKTELYNRASPYLAIYRQGLLSEQITGTGLDFSADCYLTLLPSSVPAALQLKRAHGGMVVCDCAENVDVDKHSIAPRIHPAALELVNLAAYGSLSESDRLLTVGDALGRTLMKFRRPVQVIPNFRRYEEAFPAGRLRAACGLGFQDVLLFASGNVVVGFEPVLEALVRLPANVHLAALVQLKPAEYEARMMARVTELNLGARVHFFPFVPYDELASVAADADIGLITSDVTNANGAVGLPNRLFDYLTAGLPVVVPPMPDVVALVRRHGFGRDLSVVTAENWYQALVSVLANLPAFKVAAVAARRVITWESNEDALFEFLGRPRRVTMIGFRDLTRYQRFRRIAKTLADRGTEVKAICLSADPASNTIPGVEFYHFADRYGREVGLRRVPDTFHKEDNNV